MFSLVLLSKSKFFTRVALVSLVYGTRAVKYTRSCYRAKWLNELPAANFSVKDRKKKKKNHTFGI